MSDRGIPASYRHMHGYGSHTFSLINAEGKRTWVKFHLHTQQGIKNLTDTEAEAIIAKDRESHQRDLYESIEKGDFPKWTMYIQVMTEEQAKNCPFNPANVVPGISFSPDRMLQGRLFSYGDTQRYRLGVNHHQIPVNRSRCPFLNMYHRDGQMRVDGNHGSTLGYEPNSYGEWQHQTEYKEPPLELDGAAYQWDYREDDSDYYSQPGDLFRLMTPTQQQVLFENTARAMGDIPEEIKLRHIRNCMKADENYGKGVAKALNIPLEKI